MFYLIPLILSFLLAVGFTPLIKKFAEIQNIFDIPFVEKRKIHTRKIPQLGGMAIFFSFFLTIYFLLPTGWFVDSQINLDIIRAFIVSSAILMIGGFFDDKYNFKPLYQIIFPIVAATIIIIAGIRITNITNPGGGTLAIIPILSIPLTFLWLMGMMYTTKFLDGLDGLTTGITTIGAIIIFIVSLYWNSPYSAVSVLSLALIGTCLGFLIYNWHPAKIFLGEGGSVLTGFLLGVLAIISGSKIATTLLVMGIPILDVLWVIIRRTFWEKKMPFKADRKHLHFRLLDIGFSQKKAVLLLYFSSILFGVTSLFLHTKGKIVALSILGALMIIIAIVIVNLYKRKEVSS
ncbi:undecaprenyl/decaprenyl-phosphate alpha-N-acetylglucosaminyl 1-phosphate transferase [Patescibacteria group bacterium]|nr:undecaprenyl/decaprenyl-phosphate alpha-N-acetylglucosaminyl 1-phosphate transferase [Patescibacteria group bacterium]